MDQPKELHIDQVREVGNLGPTKSWLGFGLVIVLLPSSKPFRKTQNLSGHQGSGKA